MLHTTWNMVVVVVVLVGLDASFVLVSTAMYGHWKARGAYAGALEMCSASYHSHQPKRSS